MSLPQPSFLSLELPGNVLLPDGSNLTAEAAITAAAARSIAACKTDRINFADYAGVDRSGASDMTSRIAQGLADARTQRKVLYFPAGSYGYSSGNITLQPGDTIIGDGDATQFLCLGMNQTNPLFVTQESLVQPNPNDAEICFDGVRFTGTYQQNPGSDPNLDKPFISIFSMQAVNFYRVTCEWSRTLALQVGLCGEAIWMGCNFRYIARGSIQFAGTQNVIIIGNRFRHCDDNTVSGFSLPTPPYASNNCATVVGNIQEDCPGYTISGAKRVVIANNVGQRGKLNGILVAPIPGVVATTAAIALSVTGNVLTDMLNVVGIKGLTNQSNYLVFGTQSADQGPLPAPPAWPNPSTGIVTPPYGFYDFQAPVPNTTIPISPGACIDLSSNIFMRTQPASFSATVVGGVTAGDVLSLVFQSALVNSNNPVTVNYTVQSGDDVFKAALGLAAAVNGSSLLVGAGIWASSNATQLGAVEAPALPTQGVVVLNTPHVLAASWQCASSGATILVVNVANIGIGGTLTPGDVLTVSVRTPTTASPPITANYTVQNGDTLNTASSGLAAAINAALTTAGKSFRVTGQQFNSGLISVQQIGVPAFWSTSLSPGATETLVVNYGVQYSSWGFGTMFTRDGWLDPVIGPMEMAANGVAMVTSGPTTLENVSIARNKIKGVVTAISLGKDTRFLGSSVRDNEIVDFSSRAISAPTASSGTPPTQELVIENNLFNGDPYFRSAGRAAAMNGSWNNDPANSPIAISSNSAPGIIYRRNRHRNMLQMFVGSEPTGWLIDESLVYCNPSAIGYASGNVGVGNISVADLFRYQYQIEDGNPQSATFGELLNICPLAASTMPSSGTFVRGHRVKNTNLNGFGTGGGIVEWYRMTTGSSHVLGTDWLPVYAPTTSPLGRSKVRAVPADGSTYQIQNGFNWIELAFGSNYAALTVATPTTPADGEEIVISFVGSVAALTLTPSPGQSLFGFTGPKAIAAESDLWMRWDAISSAWLVRIYALG